MILSPPLFTASLSYTSQPLSLSQLKRTPGPQGPHSSCILLSVVGSTHHQRAAAQHSSPSIARKSIMNKSIERFLIYTPYKNVSLLIWADHMILIESHMILIENHVISSYEQWYIFVRDPIVVYFIFTYSRSFLVFREFQHIPKHSGYL